MVEFEKESAQDFQKSNVAFYKLGEETNRKGEAS